MNEAAIKWRLANFKFVFKIDTGKDSQNNKTNKIRENINEFQIERKNRFQVCWNVESSRHNLNIELTTIKLATAEITGKKQQQKKTKVAKPRKITQSLLQEQKMKRSNWVVNNDRDIIKSAEIKHFSQAESRIKKDNVRNGTGSPQKMVNTMNMFHRYTI